MVSPEGLKGVLFDEAGETGTLCISDGTVAQAGSITANKDCGLKVKVRHIMSAIKFTGYHSFTGYAHAQFLPTMHIISRPQLRLLVDEIFKRFPKRAEAFAQHLLEIPK